MTLYKQCAQTVHECTCRHTVYFFTSQIAVVLNLILVNYV